MLAGTLTNLAAGIQRHLQNDCDRRDAWLLKKDDPNFKLFRDALDSRRKLVISQGIGTQPKQASPISPEDEATLWDTGVLNPETSQGLLYIVYL